MMVTLHLGDCIEVMRTLADNSVDSICTDPPYGLSDHTEKDIRACMAAWLAGEEYVHGKAGFMGKTWDSFVPGPAVWLECFRVLKPGGYLLCFASTRTDDLMSFSLRLAGFRRHPFIGWIFGSGFPKASNLSKAFDRAAGVERAVIGFDAAKATRQTAAIGTNTLGDYTGQSGDVKANATDAAKQWDGWAYGLQSLKPAIEPCLMFQKPHEGRMTDNVLVHGTGAINIDACRVEIQENLPGYRTPGTVSGGNTYGGGWAKNICSNPSDESVRHNALGRWPANLIHDGSDEVVALFPETKSGKLTAAQQVNGGFKGSVNCYGTAASGGSSNFEANSDSAARFFYSAKASKADRHDGMTLPAPVAAHGATLRDMENAVRDGKAGGNTHPTVKPTALMAYLCRLVTPPVGTVLDPFMGSGSTGRGAVLEGFDFIGIDMTQEYVEISRARINAAVLTITPAANDSKPASMDAANDAVAVALPEQPDLFTGLAA